MDTSLVSCDSSGDSPASSSSPSPAVVYYYGGIRGGYNIVYKLPSRSVQLPSNIETPPTSSSDATPNKPIDNGTFCTPKSRNASGNLPCNDVPNAKQNEKLCRQLNYKAATLPLNNGMPAFNVESLESLRSNGMIRTPFNNGTLNIGTPESSPNNEMLRTPLSNGASNSANVVHDLSDISDSLAVFDESISMTETLVFFDLETTGLPRFNGALNTQITELSFIAVAKEDFEKSEVHDLKDVRIMNKFSICVKPRCSVDPQAAKITGLNNEKLQLQHPFDESTAQMINNFLMHLPQPVCLLAHNGDGFDFPLLKAELRRVGASLQSSILVADTLTAIRTFKLFDAQVNKLKKSRIYNPNSLENLYKYYFKRKHFNRHSSEGDCIALMMVCHKLKDRILPWIEDNQRLFDTVVPMW